MIHILILAGGSGTRLWPASTKSVPKQFLDSGDGSSFLQRTVRRALSLPSNGRIVIVTHRDHYREVVRHLGIFREAADRFEILPEPIARNTAPAIALGVSRLNSMFPETDTVFVMPADHIIKPLERLSADLSSAIRLADEGYLVTFGIPPTRPDTGFGYIEGGESIGAGVRVRSFKEKPDEEGAKAFIDAGNFVWNSGMFVFRAGCFLEELSRHAPSVSKPFSSFGPGVSDRPEDGFHVVGDDENTAGLYAALPSVSIDYAVMEMSGRVAMVKATFSWSDIGSWDEYSSLFHDSEDKEIFQTGSDNNFVMSDIPVALCGVEDLMVIIRGGKALVCRKGSSQSVKNLIDQFRTTGRHDLL